jgi:hypothetical protein
MWRFVMDIIASVSSELVCVTIATSRPLSYTLALVVFLFFDFRFVKAQSPSSPSPSKDRRLVFLAASLCVTR